MGRINPQLLHLFFHTFFFYSCDLCVVHSIGGREDSLTVCVLIKKELFSRRTLKIIFYPHVILNDNLLSLCAI